MSLLVDSMTLKAPEIERFRLLLQRCFHGTILYDVPMKEYTTFRIGGPADIIAYPSTEEDLRKILLLCKETCVPYHVIGRGSNILVRDGGIRGVVIDLSRGFKSMTLVDDKWIIADSGLPIKKIARFARDNGLRGLEFAVGIPGSLGGAIAMNAGAYGYEMENLIEWIEIMTMAGEKIRITKSDLDFEYRKLNLYSPGIILRAMLKLDSDDVKYIEERMHSFIKKRNATQRVDYPNAGSIFKNPSDTSAGRIIDEIGFKGMKEGRAMVSNIHGNYIVNLGGATCREVLRLIRRIKEEVFLRKGIPLELEVKVIGED